MSEAGIWERETCCVWQRESGVRKGGRKEGLSSCFGAEVHHCWKAAACGKEVNNRSSTSVWMSCVVFQMSLPCIRTRAEAHTHAHAHTPIRQQSATSGTSSGHRQPPQGNRCTAVSAKMQLQRRMATATPSTLLQSRTRRRAKRRLRLTAEVDLWHLAPNSRQGQRMLFTSGKDSGNR